MYIQFDNEKDYLFLKDIVLEYEDIIMNLNDLDEDGFAFSDQESRSAQVINLSNFISLFSYFLIWILLLIIIAFLLFWLKLTFYRFWKQVEVEKLLWAWYFSIKVPFLTISFIVLVWAFLLMLLYFFWFFQIMNEYFLSVFQVWAEEYLLPWQYIWQYLTQEFVILIALSLMFTFWFLGGLIKKV